MKATIWKAQKNGATKWVVAYHVEGKRVRKFFDQEYDAVAYRNEICGDPDVTGAAWALVAKNRRFAILQALDLADKNQLDLYECVRKCISPGPGPEGSRPGPPAPAESKPVQPSPRATKTVTEASDAYLVAKISASRSETYCDGLKVSLDALCKPLGHLPVISVTPELIEQWLKRWSGGWSRNTKLAHASQMFNYALERKWCVENPCNPVDKAIIDSKVPAIFTAAECEKIMRAATPDTIAYFALCMFGGLRCGEAENALWKDIDLDKRLVHVPARKTHRWRDVDLTENAMAWLRMASREDDLKTRIALSHSTLRRRRDAIIEQLGLKWVPHILRHTCASMMAAIGRTNAEITDQLGHDVEMLLKHYRARIPREQAEAFWAIMPFRIASEKSA